MVESTYQCITPAQGWPSQQCERVAYQKGELTREQLLEPQTVI